MMSDESNTDPAPDKPRKVKLAPMTEWKLPTPVARDEPPPGAADAAIEFSWSSHWPWLAGGAGVLALLLVVFVVASLRSDGGGGSAGPNARAPSPQRAREAVIQMPNGMIIDQTNRINYELADWLTKGDPRPQTFAFDRLKFAPGSTEIDPRHRGTIQGLAIVLGSFPSAKIMITGSETGELGKAQAQAIHDALLRFAVDGRQLSVSENGGDGGPPRITVSSERTVGNALDS